VLGLQDKDESEMNEVEKKLLAEVALLDAGHQPRREAAKSLVFKAEPEREDFYIGPGSQAGLQGQTFYSGPQTAEFQVQRSQHIPLYLLVRRSMSVPDMMTRGEYLSYEGTRPRSVREVARASVGL